MHGTAQTDQNRRWGISPSSTPDHGGFGSSCPRRKVWTSGRCAHTLALPHALADARIASSPRVAAPPLLPAVATLANPTSARPGPADHQHHSSTLAEWAHTDTDANEQPAEDVDISFLRRGGGAADLQQRAAIQHRAKAGSVAFAPCGEAQNAPKRVPTHAFCLNETRARVERAERISYLATRR